MVILVSTLYLIIVLATLVLFLIKYRLSYWKIRGIPHDEPSFPYGNTKGLGTTRHIRDITKDYYEKFKHSGPFGGFFFFLSPAVLVYDLNLVRDILIKDFNNFIDRGLYHNEDDDPLSGHLFALDGNKWRHLRNKLSPTFTSGKIKFMFPIVISVGDQLLQTFNEIFEQNPIIEVKDILARFTTDVIGTCAFGINCDSLKNPKTEFRLMGARAIAFDRHCELVKGLMMTFPNLARKLNMKETRDDVHHFFTNVVKETVKYRENSSVKRNDFMDLLLEVKNSGNGLTIDQVAAQAFIFFLGGFETSATTMGFALFELALNQEIQNKLRSEIDDLCKKNNGKLTYECLTEMHYMEKVIKETLRKYFILTSLIRKPLCDYATANSKYTIPKGRIVLIPVDAIHHDPDIYPDPEKFDPERFSPEEIKKRHPMSWLGFGDGPRNCIGLRFGKMQTYIGLAVLLKNFKFHYSEKSPNPLEIDVKNQILAVKGGIYLRVERI